MIFTWCAAALADVGFESPPHDAVETVVTVVRDGEPAAGETVRVVVRPGLAGSRELAVGITDGRGRVRWTPEASGLTEVRAGSERVRVLVAASGVPATTSVLLTVLTLLTLGYLVVGFRPRARP